MRIKLKKELWLTAVLFFYYLGNPIIAAMTIVAGDTVANLIFNMVLFTAIILYCIHRPPQNMFKVLGIYLLVTIVIVYTIMVHPEYINWYSHDFYGIKNHILPIKNGIWALMIIMMYKDDDCLLKDLRLVTIAIFLAYFGKFVLAMHRGYWLVTTNGIQTRASYDMEFGYRILFTAAFWGAQALLAKKKRYWWLYLFSIAVILIGGSRGPAVWVIGVFPAVIPFAYRNMNGMKKRFLIITCVFLVPMIVVAIINIEQILISVGAFLLTLGVSSRTIESLALGKIADANGRNIIYSMAIDLIKTGGPFGHGFYGDRYTIGQRFYWGYSHDVFLELLVTFGYLGGGILIVILLVGIFKLYEKAITTNRQIIFVTFFVTSLKLILSNSFWYEPSFWALIALMIRWNTTKKIDKNT